MWTSLLVTNEKKTVAKCNGKKRFLYTLVCHIGSFVIIVFSCTPCLGLLAEGGGEGRNLSSTGDISLRGTALNRAGKRHNRLIVIKLNLI